MKKLHVLIPSLVATVGMPLVSLVGCGNQGASIDEIIVDDFVFDGSFQSKIIKSKVDLQKNKKYCFVFKIKDLQESSPIGWFRFTFFDFDEMKSIKCYFGGLSLEVDGEWLRFFGWQSSPPSIQNGYYFPGSDDEFNTLSWIYEKQKDDSIVKIHFVSMQDLYNTNVVVLKE